MNEELEPEVLSYREFKNRETLLAWERRRQAYESEPLLRQNRHGRAFMPSHAASERGEAPPLR